MIKKGDLEADVSELTEALQSMVDEAKRHQFQRLKDLLDLLRDEVDELAEEFATEDEATDDDEPQDWRD